MTRCHLLAFGATPYADLHCPMRIDQRLYDAIDSHHQDYTVRFYTWPQTTLSIGRFQRLDAALAQRLLDQNIAWVRRPTGGQAILHAGDLTFSVIGPLSPERQHHLLDTYQRIAQGLMKGLRKLGVEAETILHSAQGQTKSASCYTSSSQADLQINGTKLVGCAQVRRRRAFLQQGVLYLQAPRAQHQQLFAEAMPVVDLESLCNPMPPVAELAQVLGEGIQTSLLAD